ncbi:MULTISPECIES: DUF1659 domain-containing protein [Terrisporobacter]|uniref:DUF1659 domain-containing protein n=1 Tax=Terrisporobacter othiniensis TaxID=1577792 RepID=A0A0B3VYI6_9FIRM|nr:MULTISPECIES: DUF1659 domain-containing protein [Terrisporobacter]KHS57789.1 hypothetical protein QX51_06410 [Terrisporobacter othiniensis]MCC3670606.1 DUF1659 domain-containing protein [Terrisporobacter mayombei]MDU6983212.1 DUF1659 domain-containing protein [Terrisporobacter othiniensis]
MAVVSTPNASSIKVKFDHGTDLNGDRVIKTKTYSSIKSGASNDNIMSVVLALAGLQEHTLAGTNRLDNSSLSE